MVFISIIKNFIEKKYSLKTHFINSQDPQWPWDTNMLQKFKKNSFMLFRNSFTFKNIFFFIKKFEKQNSWSSVSLSLFHAEWEFLRFWTGFKIFLYSFLNKFSPPFVSYSIAHAANRKPALFSYNSGETLCERSEPAFTSQTPKVLQWSLKQQNWL